MTRLAIRYDHQRKHVAQMLALLLLATSGSSVMARDRILSGQERPGDESIDAALRPQTIDEMVDNLVGRILARIGIDNELFFRWKEAGAGCSPFGNGDA